MLNKYELSRFENNDVVSGTIKKDGKVLHQGSLKLGIKKTKDDKFENLSLLNVATPSFTISNLGRDGKMIVKEKNHIFELTINI